MGIAIVSGLGLMLAILPLINLLLPNFKTQQRIVEAASMLKMSQADLERLHQNRLVLALSERLEKKKLLDRLFSEQTRKMYNGLGKKESFAIFISKTVLLSLFLGIMPLLVNLMIPNPLFIMMAPIAVVLFFVGLIYKIKEDYQARQNIILHDLPDLIAKIVSSLSVGRRLEQTLEEFSRTCHPTLGNMIKTLVANFNIMPSRNALQIFAQDVDFPEMYDFVSVVNVIEDKGYSQGEAGLKAISKDLKKLRKRAMQLRTQGNPSKFNLLYGLIILAAITFPFQMLFKLFNGFTSI